MKFSLPKFVIALFMLFSIAFLSAATLTYSPTVPQTGDSALVIANKAAVANTTTATKLTTLLAGNSYNNISTATTTVVKASAGVLERIVINTGGADSVITVYDNTAGSGTKIATISGVSVASLTYQVTAATGITVVTAGSSPANITVVYR